MNERTAILGSFSGTTVRSLAGYKPQADTAFHRDVRVYNLPIRSHAPESWRDSRFRIGPVTRAAVLGRLRSRGIGPAKARYYLDQVTDAQVEEAVARLWADVETRVWVCLPAAQETGDARVFAHTHEQMFKMLERGAEVVFDLTDTLNSLMRRN